MVSRGRLELPAICLTCILNTVTLPIRPPGHIKQDAVSKPGLERTRHPQRAGLQQVWLEKNCLL